MEFLILLAVALLPTGEVEFPIRGDVEKRVAIVHVQDWIFEIAAVVRLFRDLYH